METQIKVSVIIPVYNVKPYLRQCMDSVMNQTLREIEIICVDDGSTDGSLDILREYEARDSRIKVLTQSNQYAGVARNNGMKAATGKYYVFLDGDDFFQSDMLEKEYRQCEKYQAEICLCGYDRYNEQEKKLVSRPSTLASIKTQPFNHDTEPELYQITLPNPWSKMFSAEFIRREKLQFQALPRANDAHFVFCALALADKIVAVNEPLVHYRIEREGSLQTGNVSTPTAFLEALAAIRRTLEEKNVFSRVELSFVRSGLSQIHYTLNKLKGSSAYDELLDKVTSQYWQVFQFHRFQKDPYFTQKMYAECVSELLHARQKQFEPYVRRGTAYTNGAIPKVSVIIAVYNVEEYLRECVDSILNQTLREIEIICINDGSLDDSLRILEEYADADNRITIISQKNGGQSSARNAGMELARGEYVYFIDSDDFLRTDALTTLSERSDRDQLEVLFFERKKFYEDESQKDIFLPGEIKYGNYPDIYDGVTLFKRMLDDQTYSCSPCRMLLRRDFVTAHAISFYNGIIHEDELFTFYVLMHAVRISHTPEIYYSRRVRANSTMTQSASSKNVIGYFTCAQEIMKYGLSCAADEQRQALTARRATTLLNSAQRIYAGLPPAEQMKASFGNPVTQILFDRMIAASCKNVNGQTDSVGRTITWLPRKIRGGIRCYKEHGFSYTCNRVLVKLNWKTKKIRRAVTWPLRKIRGGIRCYQEHGFMYMLDRVLIKLHLKKSKKMVVRDYEYYKNLKPRHYEKELEIWFLRRTGDKLNLKNPVTYNEKIQWMKLYDSTPLKTRLADKYLVREWVAEKIGEEYLVSLLGVWDSFDEIDFDKLPNQFVLKANHGSGWNIIVKNKAELDIADAKRKFDQWMKKNYAFGGFELHYMNIPPKIIAEEYIAGLSGDVMDYRFFCFDGEAKWVWVDIASGTPEHKRCVLDTEWNALDVKVHWPPMEEVPHKPECYEKMLELAKKLSEGFAHVRVDFYDDNGQIYLGEMTFTSAAGTQHATPRSFEVEMGNMIHLPPKSPIPKRKLCRSDCLFGKIGNKLQLFTGSNRRK